MKPRRLIEAGPEPTGAQLDRATLRRFIAIEMRIEAIEKRMPPPPTPPATGWRLLGAARMGQEAGVLAMMENPQPPGESTERFMRRCRWRGRFRPSSAARRPKLRAPCSLAMATALWSSPSAESRLAASHFRSISPRARLELCFERAIPGAVASRQGVVDDRNGAVGIACQQLRLGQRRFLVRKPGCCARAGVPRPGA